MSTHGVISNDAPGSGSVTNVSMKLEVVVIPVSDVDRARVLLAARVAARR
jgi:hypothetical protein